MDLTSQHWKVFQRVKMDFMVKVREFMVIGDGGEGVLMFTEPDGEGFWFGKMELEYESKEATEPTRLGVRNLVGMAHGLNHIVLLDRMGMVYTFGRNLSGQLGQGTIGGTHFTPQLILECLHRFTKVRCGIEHSLALTQDGMVCAWGGNHNGQVGLPRSTPRVPSMRQISELDSHRVVAIECGAFHSLALTDQGQVYGWGYNGWGQLAQNPVLSISTPVLLPCASPVTQIAAGYRHTLMLTEDGQVFACGSNRCGQLGRPTSTKSSSRFCQVPGLPPISQIASHFARDLSIALSTDGLCFVWGEWNKLYYRTPLQLFPTYSTIESPLSSKSTHRNTPHSVRVKVPQFSLASNLGTLTEKFEQSTFIDDLFAPDPLWSRFTWKFDNPDSEPDLQFELGAMSILAHRFILQISSANFTALLSESCRRSSDLSPSTPSTSLPQSNFTPTRHTNNPSESHTISTSNSPNITRIPIHDHSYSAFQAFLGYIYCNNVIGRFEVPVDLLPELYELSLRFQCADLQQRCFSRMFATVSLSTCCPYFQLADRHQLSQLQSRVVRFVANNLLQVFRTEAFKSMDLELGHKLTLAAANFDSSRRLLNKRWFIKNNERL